MNFSETRIQAMLTELRDEYGPEIATRELAVLELEDLARKGCTHESASKFDQCRDCPDFEKCPVLDWQKRHPEYANDELVTKIKILEAGGLKAYEERILRQVEAKTQAEAKKLAVKAAKDKVIELFMKAACDNADWDDEEEAALEAYVQARLADK